MSPRYFGCIRGDGIGLRRPVSRLCLRVEWHATVLTGLSSFAEASLFVTDMETAVVALVRSVVNSRPQALAPRLLLGVEVWKAAERV